MAKRNNNRSNNRGRNPKDSSNPKGRKEATNQRDSFDERRAYSDHDSTKTSDKPSEAGVNNPEWWTKNGSILNDTASVPQMNPVGAPLHALSSDLDMHFASNKSYKPDFSKMTIPGICTIECMHGPGIAYDVNDPVNQAFLSQMEFERANITPNIPYDYADHAMVCLGMGEAYAWYAIMRRAYGVARQFTFSNQYLPIELLKQLGFDPDLVIGENLTQMRFIMNQYVLKLGAFPVPPSHYYDRLLAIYSNIFIDENSSKAQMYAFVPACLRAINVYSDTGTSLDVKATDTPVGSWDLDLRKYYRTSAKIGLTEMKEICNRITENLRNDDDIYSIIGNIINPKTWGNNVFAIPEVPENEAFPVAADVGMLHQIMNATCYYDVDPTDVTQDPSVGSGKLEYQPWVAIRCPEAWIYGSDNQSNIEMAIARGPKLINNYGSDYLDPMSVVYYTRFCSVLSTPTQPLYDNVTQSQMMSVSSGAIEILGRMHLTKFVYNTDGSLRTTRSITLATINMDLVGGSHLSNVYNNEERMAMLAAFNYHPTCWFIVHDMDEEDTVKAAEPIQQWENVVTLI